MGGSRSYRLRDRRRSTLLRGLFDPRHRRGDRRCRSESIADDLKSAYEWVGHAHTVFEIVGDRLYYADYSTLGTGGAIVAVDLSRSPTISKALMNGWVTLIPSSRSSAIDSITRIIRPSAPAGRSSLWI